MIPMEFYDLEGTLIATGYERVVIGERGPYIEIDLNNMVKTEIEVEPNQEYRLLEPWRSKVFYFWYRTKKTHAKVYYQVKPVNYADYKLDFCYISPDELVWDGTRLYAELGTKPGERIPSTYP